MEQTQVFIHPSACVDEGVTIGAGTKIWHFSHIQRGAVLGAGCTIGQNVYIAENVRIGSHVKIQNGVSVFEGVELEDYVFCGPSAVFTNVKPPAPSTPGTVRLGIYARSSARARRSAPTPRWSAATPSGGTRSWRRARW
jgi:UDP-2-acetamido-3-amino-2,3-dideoxy-glucuronate N-acetyltransferase